MKEMLETSTLSIHKLIRSLVDTSSIESVAFQSTPRDYTRYGPVIFNFRFSPPTLRKRKVIVRLIHGTWQKKPLYYNQYEYLVCLPYACKTGIKNINLNELKVFPVLFRFIR